MNFLGVLLRWETNATFSNSEIYLKPSEVWFPSFFLLFTKTDSQDKDDICMYGYYTEIIIFER